MKKIISMLLILLTTAVSFADSTSNGSDLEKLLGYGLTIDEAEILLRVDRIMDELRINGQQVDLVDNKVVVTESNSGISISKSDEIFITKLMEKELRNAEK